MKWILSLLLMLSLWPLQVQAQPQSVKPGDPFIIINKANNKLAFIDDNEVKEILPVGTGKSQELTPEGIFTVKVKAVNPYYRKKNIPGGDPRNPLGSRWIGFDARYTDGRIYGIHGTNQPSSIGKYISNGCVRMHKSDVERLYEKVPIGTKVLITISNEDFKTLAKKNGAIK
ncbi:Putative L,D-transpeptidase YkuD [Peribacillus simplex]|uniref:L,D-transpeptidase n=1 Tax=Peribacillus simplex TaxID=1478 RepID=UPI001DBAE2BB|nr:L,D-transpeptidase [Peribacillus simplex]CAH0218431.1 Putative L,D-transpeptidase YkuD [Peribacillus simplex]